MRRFDVKATDRKLDQYWSSLQTNNNTVTGQVSGSSIGNIVFSNQSDNVLSNSGWEQGMTDWLASPYVVDNAVSHSGSQSIRVTADGSIKDIIPAKNIAVEPGQTWYAEVWVKHENATPTNGTGSYQLGATCLDQNKQSPSWPAFKDVVVNTTTSPPTRDWYKISGTIVIPAGKYFLQIRPSVRNTMTGGTFWYDDLAAYRVDTIGVLPTLNNRNITSDSATSIIMNQWQGIASVSKPLSDFSFSLLLYPYVSDVWLISWKYQDAKIGIRLNSDSTMSLIWPEDNVIVEKKIPYTEQASYCVFSRNGSVVSLLLNNETVSVINDTFELGNITFGGGTGMALVDRIALSIAGSLPTAYEYADLFKSQRLDTAPRPDGASSFAYLTDVMTPDVITLMKADFGFSEDYYYASVQNVRDYGVFSIERSATFPVEYSLDAGETWANLPGKLRLSEVYESVLFRHQTNTEHEFWIDVTTTYDSQIVLSDFNAKLNGIYHLPNANGRGYYDADSGFMGLASLDIDGQESAKVRTIEMLASFESDPTSMLQTFIDTYKSVYSASYQLQPSAATVTTYVNGQPRALSTLKLNQMYHIVFVLSQPVEYASINKAKTIGINLVGIGASNVAYSASDAFYLFCTFAGNTFISSLETVARVSDGSHPNSPTNQAGVVLDLQWNG